MAWVSRGEDGVEKRPRLVEEGEENIVGCARCVRVRTVKVPVRSKVG